MKCHYKQLVLTKLKKKVKKKTSLMYYSVCNE